MLLLPGFPAAAEQFGLFSYEVIPGGIEITDYPTDQSGAVKIPAEIEGQPVISIGVKAFSGCELLTSITMPNSVTNIGIWAFAYCYGLTSIGIPENVTNIERYAFFSCNNLTGISIPAATVMIGDLAFGSCGDMTSISVALANAAYSSSGGVLFNKGGDELIQCPGGMTGAYSLPPGVTKIGDNGFYDCAELTTIFLGGNITEIGDSAFYHCDGLNWIDLPAQLSVLGEAAFLRCFNLESIGIDPANPHFSSLDGVLFNALATELIAYPAARTGSYTIPPGVITIHRMAFGYSALAELTMPSSMYHINRGAFFYATKLTHVTIPGSVADLGDGAFSPCPNLNAVIFMGDAPAMGSDVFDDAAPGFAVYYLTAASGFITPTWEDYPAVEIDESVHPAATWLLSHDIAYDTPLDQDLNGDGVDLLMAYALNLDPNRNLAGSMPRGALDVSTLSMSFTSGRSGVAYSVETCTDLQDWTTDGVSLSGTAGYRTASVPRAGPRRFLRLKVALDN